MLEEAQKVHVRRDEERMKAKAKIMKTAEHDSFPQGKSPETKQETAQKRPEPNKLVCTYCNKEGHGHWYCYKKLRDQAAYQVEGQMLNN